MDAQSSIRIIGGKWRSRKVSFMTKDGLRPTPDRVRETLFNWLAPFMVDAVCLDLYAGSGVLGLEALSRGAAAVYALDSDRDCVQRIAQNQQVLQAENYTLLNKSALDWLQAPQFSADIIFVDPPYKQNILYKTLDLLEQNNWVKSGGVIYFEQDQPLDAELLPAGWNIWRESKAGKVFFYLAQRQD